MTNDPDPADLLQSGGVHIRRTCVLTDGLIAVEAACQEALEHGVSSAAVILNILARSRDPARGTILSIPQALKMAHEASPTAPATTVSGGRTAMERTEFWN